MGFTQLIIKPNLNRPKFFDGGEGDPGAVAVFPCSACSNNIHIPLWDFLSQYASWKYDLPQQQVLELASLFRLNKKRVMEHDVYIGHGSRLPVVGGCECDSCGQQLMVCISCQELSPLRYEAVIDGVATWIPD